MEEEANNIDEPVHASSAVSPSPKSKPRRKRRPPVVPWKKPKGMPKRPLSAYNLFFKQERERMLKIGMGGKSSGDNTGTGGRDNEGNEKSTSFDLASGNASRKHAKSSGIGFANLARIVAAKWKDLDPALKEPFETIANKEKDRYNEQMVEWRAMQKKNHVKAEGDDSSWNPTVRTFDLSYGPPSGSQIARQPNQAAGECFEGRNSANDESVLKHGDPSKRNPRHIYSGSPPNHHPQVSPSHHQRGIGGQGMNAAKNEDSHWASSPKRHAAPGDHHHLAYSPRERAFYAHEGFPVSYTPASSDYYEGRGYYPYYYSYSPDGRHPAHPQAPEDAHSTQLRLRTYPVYSSFPPTSDEAYSHAVYYQHSQIHNGPYGQPHNSYPHSAGHPTRPPHAYAYPPPGAHGYYHYRHGSQASYEEETLQARRNLRPDEVDEEVHVGEPEPHLQHQRTSPTKEEAKASSEVPTTTTSHTSGEPRTSGSHEECSLLESTFENIDTNLDTDTVDYLTTLQFD